MQRMYEGNRFNNVETESYCAPQMETIANIKIRKPIPVLEAHSAEIYRYDGIIFGLDPISNKNKEVKGVNIEVDTAGLSESPSRFSMSLEEASVFSKVLSNFCAQNRVKKSGSSKSKPQVKVQGKKSTVKINKNGKKVASGKSLSEKIKEGLRKKKEREAAEAKAKERAAKKEEKKELSPSQEQKQAVKEASEATLKSLPKSTGKKPEVKKIMAKKPEEKKPVVKKVMLKKPEVKKPATLNNLLKKKES